MTLNPKMYTWVHWQNGAWYSITDQKAPLTILQQDLSERLSH